MAELKKQTTQQGKRPKTADQPSLFDWDETVARAKDMKEVLPRLKMDVGDEEDVEITSERPYVVEYDDKESGEHKSFPVVDIVHDGARKTLAVSAVSLQNGIGRIYAEDGTLEGARVHIMCESYEHAKFGKTKGYRVTRQPEIKATNKAIGKA